jgi:hypothetical protein
MQRDTEIERLEKTQVADEATNLDAADKRI